MAGLPARRLLPFAAFATLAVCTEWMITRTATFQRGPVVPRAVLFDLVVVLPLLFAAVVLRPARRPLLDAAPVLALGAFVAATLLATRTDLRIPLRVTGAVAELAVLTLLVRRVRKATSELRGAASDNLLLQVGSLTDPVLRIAGAEFLVLYYALVGPFVRRPARANEFGYTEESGLGGLLFALGFVTTMEGLGMHLLLHAWSARAAWVLTALSAYTLLWLLAAFHAARLRPVVLSGDHLLVRSRPAVDRRGSSGRDRVRLHNRRDGAREGDVARGLGYGACAAGDVASPGRGARAARDPPERAAHRTLCG